MRSILRYIISFVLLLNVSNVGAQEKKTEEKETKPALLNGLTVQVDIASLAYNLISNGGTYSSEASVQADLKHKYFPIVEVGFGGADKVTADNIGFKTNGLFGRVGVDLNLLKQKEGAKPTNNLFLAGVRLGFTSFLYDISNVTISDNYWGTTEVLNYEKQSATKIWYEIVAGVKVEVIKNIYMGWTIRTKNLLNKNAEGEVSPWYVPGFGVNTSSTWGFSYSIGYRF